MRPVLQHITPRRTGDTAAAGYMLPTATFFSVIPLAVAIAEGAHTPLIFNTTWRLGLLAGLIAGTAAYLRILQPTLADFCRRQLADPDFRKALRQRLREPLLPLAAVNGLDYALLAWSLQFIHTSFAAVMYETWPIAFVLMRSRLERIPFGGRTLAIFVLALAGVALVVASQSTAGHPATLGLNPSTIAGGTLALLGGIASASTALTFRWAAKLCQDLPRSPGLGSPQDEAALKLLPVLTAFVITNLIALPAGLTLGILSGERLPLSQNTAAVLALAFVGGAAVHAPGAILYRMSNTASNHLGVNALYYITPALTLAWLALLALLPAGTLPPNPLIQGIDVAHPGRLIAGAVTIIAANMLITVGPGIRRT